jgi:ABC-2 type transport system ATP-binding protein
MSPPSPAIQTTDLAKRYGDVSALDGLSLSVGRGELYGFLGPNGAGKSTTINILTGQLRPDEGTASVLGIDPVANPVEARGAIGVLPENGRPPSFLTVREYFEFVATARDLEDIDARVREWADRLEFAHKLDTLGADLSQGERQKVMITAAFVHEPELVFIDEPLTNLDPIMQERAKRFFREYREDGNTIFLSTHFIGTAEEVCTKVGVVNRGRLLAETDPRTLDEESLLDRFFAVVDADRADSELAIGTDPAAPGAGGEDASPGASTDGTETGAESVD